MENLKYTTTETTIVPVKWLGRISPLAFLIVCIFASAGGGFTGLVATAFLYAFGVEDNQKQGAATVLFFFFGLIIPIVWLIIARSRAKPVQYIPVVKPRAAPEAFSIRTPLVANTQSQDIETSAMDKSSMAPAEQKTAARIASGQARYRVIDWSRALQLVAIVPLATFIGIIFVLFITIGRTPANFLIAFTSGVVCLGAAVFTHFRGTVIDTLNDTLSFPTLLFRRSVKLSDIRDANAEFWSRTVPGYNFGDSSVRERDGTQRIYAANLSGEFGGRQIKFWSKLRRDHFLSHLRQAAPHVRITMWR